MMRRLQSVVLRRVAALTSNQRAADADFTAAAALLQVRAAYLTERIDLLRR